MAERTEGQIIARGEHTWLLRVPRGESVSGTRRYFNETVKGSKTDARKRLRELLTQRDNGLLADAGALTLDAYLDRWLKAIAPKIGPRTHSDYRYDLARYIRPALGARRLAKLTALDIQGVYADLQSGKSTGRALGARTIRKTHAALNAALNQAVRWNVLPVNPARAVTLPKRTHQEMHVFTAAEAERFRQAAAAAPQGTLFMLALATGMRPGEYLALQWKHVDLSAGTVRVERALAVVDGKAIFAAPKTPRSRRTIPLPPSVTRLLAAHKAEQDRLRPTPLDGRGLVFPNLAGGPLDETNLSHRQYKALLKAAGLDSRRFRLYDLRHTCATLLLLAGENPKVVSERLGHASVTLTLDTYSHVLPTMQEAAAQKLELLLFGASG